MIRPTLRRCLVSWTATLAAAGVGLPSAGSPVADASPTAPALAAGLRLMIGSGSTATDTLIVRSARHGDVPPALLIGLHGYGMDAAQIASLVVIEPAIDHVYLAPEGFHRLGDGSRAWFPIDLVDDRLEVDRTALDTFFERMATYVEDAIEHTGADPERVVIVGYSQGGASALALALRRPDLATAFVGLAGAFVGPAWIDAPAADRRWRPRLFVGHGTLDALVSTDAMRHDVERLRQLGVDVEYREYPRPHVVSAAERRDVATFVESVVGRSME